MAQTTPNIVTAFGVRRVWIATPASTPVWVEVPAVTSAAYKAIVGEVEQTGNDTVLDMWYFGQKGTISVKASRAALSVFSQLSGVSNTSTASYNYISFGRSEELIPPVVSVRGFVVGKDDSLNKVHIIIYWYKTHVKTTMEAYPDSQYGKLAEVMITFTAFKSSTDETGTTIPSGNGTNGQAIGRLEYWIASLSPLTGWE